MVRTNHLEASDKKKKKKQDTLSPMVAQTPTITLHEGGYCTPDQCFIGQPPSPSLSTLPSASLPSDTTLSPNSYPSLLDPSPTNHSLTEEGEFSALFSDDLYQAMKSAAQQGFLTALLITLMDEFVTAYLTLHGYSPEQIDRANQAMRALTLIALGTSVTVAIGMPVSNYLLTTCGLSKETASYVTAGTLITVGLFTNPLMLYAAAMLMAISVNMGTTTLTRRGCEWMKHGFFADKEDAASKELIPTKNCHSQKSPGKNRYL